MNSSPIAPAVPGLNISDQPRGFRPVRAKVWLDQRLGRITMYRLVLFSLIALAAVAVVMSLVGGITYTVGEMALSALVLIAVTYASNAIFAGLYGVHPHTESTFITAGLLFFIFQPSTDSKALVAMAIAALVASSSKYLLAVRGRHIFNPAAIGAVWVSLFSIGYSGWWVATPVLVWVTLVAAALVLYRTRRVQLGAIFVVTALVIITVRGLQHGADFSTALTSVFTSYPILFFGGFMLSEPLTLPPLKWQQYAEAALVAILFSVPITIGTVFLAPECALVGGNLLAFAFGQRHGIRLVLQRRRQLSPSNYEFTFRASRPVGFRAGQYLELTLPHSGVDSRGTRRVFSISSAPGASQEIKLGVKIPQNSSSFKKELSKLRTGEMVVATGVSGDFLLPRTDSRKLLMIAGGIGITPFLSHLQHRASGSGNADVVVVYAVASAEEISYAEELRRSGAGVILVGPTRVQDIPSWWRFGGSGRVDGALLAIHVPDIKSRQVFVSGPPAMVDGVRSTLRTMGVRRVKADYFSGY